LEQVTRVTTGSLGAEPPAARGQRGYEGGAPNASAIFPVFPKNKAFSSIFGLNLS